MSAGWIGLLIGCGLVVVFLLAVALGRAAARGDQVEHRAAVECWRERERQRQDEDEAA